MAQRASFLENNRRIAIFVSYEGDSKPIFVVSRCISAREEVGNCGQGAANPLDFLFCVAFFQQNSNVVAFI